MEKSTKNSRIRIARYFLFTIGFWVILAFVFHTNNLEADGTDNYGIPYKVVSLYWSRKENVRYDYLVDYGNLLLDLLFVFVVTVFYYILFKPQIKK